MWKQAEKSRSRIFYKTTGLIPVVGQCYEKEEGGGNYASLKTYLRDLTMRWNTWFWFGQTSYERYLSDYGEI